MKTTRAARAARFILVLTALLLPSLSLLPLGGLYLWQNGYLLWWAIGTTAIVTVVFIAQHWLLGRPDVATADPSTPPLVDAEPSSQHWTAAEQRAWADVKSIAARINIEKLTDAKDLFDLGHHTVNAVARRLHPEKSDALWQFTMPEALAITERVSQRLGRFIESNIPFGDRLTVSQVLTVYSWRSVADVAEKAYDIWRIIRLANPATAITHEARERLSRAMLTWGKEHVSRRLAETFVLEVGRAAIDLYGGRLKISTADILANRFDPAGVADAQNPYHGAPLRILVAGNAPARVPALAAMLNAIQQDRAEVIAAFVRGDTSNIDVLRLTAIEVIETKARGQSVRDLDTLANEAKAADIVAWARAGIEPPEQFERSALRTLIGDGHSLPPALLPVAYVNGEKPLDRDSAIASVEHALEAVYAGPVGKPVIIPADGHLARDTSAALWMALSALSMDARRVQLARGFEALKNRRDWAGAARQAASAVGSLAKSMLAGRTGKS